MYRYDEEQEAWIPLDDPVVDWEERTVSGSTTQPGRFVAIAKEKRPEEPLEEPKEPGGLWTDVAGHWAEEAIGRFAANGWIAGYPDGTFQPDRPVAKAEFVALVVRVLGLEEAEGNPFADTAGHWAQGVIAAAHREGIVEGAHREGIVEGAEGSPFGPDDPLTREEMAVLVVRAFGLRAEGSAEVPFADERDIAEGAKEAVGMAASRGIVMGYGDGTFRPKSRLTRAEAVTILVRVLQSAL